MSAAEQQTSPTWQGLKISAAGMCCAVGYHLAAAACALRASMDHFQESAFYDRTGAPLVASMVPLHDLIGTKRLAAIARYAVYDCIIAAGGVAPEHTALLLLAAEQGRPHTELERYQETYLAIEAHCHAKFHPSSAILPSGRAGIGSALLHAHTLLQSGEVKNVLLVGVDSYLNAATIEHLLREKRLLAKDNCDGFIPGEAAAALLLEIPQTHSAGLQITGIGQAREEAQPNGDIPNRSIGLTLAMRQALELADIAPSECNFRMGSQSGEQFFAKEAANAITRVMSEGGDYLPVLAIAEGVGETGAAAGVLMLTYLSVVMEQEDGPGFTGLLHLANDAGLRCALVVEQFAD